MTPHEAAIRKTRPYIRCGYCDATVDTSALESECDAMLEALRWIAENPSIVDGVNVAQACARAIIEKAEGTAEK